MLYIVERGDTVHSVSDLKGRTLVTAGKGATPEVAEEMCRVIRTVIRTHHGDAADDVRILYGGSVKPDNAKELMDMEDIDGALVGGASLDPVDFLDIIHAAEN